jgi:hypothetical protein
VSLFEFIVGMISVILALAVAQLFVGIADLMQNRARVRFYLPHTIWVANIFLVMFLHWWSLWTFRDLSWNFAMFFFSLLGPSLLFLAATVVSPRGQTTESINLEDHFNGIRKMFFSIMVATIILISVDGPLFGTEPPINGIRIAQLTILATYVWGLFTQNKLAHFAISLVFLGSTIFVVIFRFLPGQG